MQCNQNLNNVYDNIIYSDSEAHANQRAKMV